MTAVTLPGSTPLASVTVKVMGMGNREAPTHAGGVPRFTVGPLLSTITGWEAEEAELAMLSRRVAVSRWVPSPEAPVLHSPCHTPGPVMVSGMVEPSAVRETV